MAGQRGFWDIEERLAALTAEGDPLDKLFARLNDAIAKAGYLPMGAADECLRIRSELLTPA